MEPALVMRLAARRCRPCGRCRSTGTAAGWKAVVAVGVGGRGAAAIGEAVQGVVAVVGAAPAASVIGSGITPIGRPKPD